MAKPKRILIVDDDELARDIYRSVLEPEGYEVVEAPDGKRGVDLFRKGGIALALVDLHMPGMDGVATIRAMDPKKAKVPVIAISGTAGGGEHDPLKDALAAGATAAIEKGFDHTKLLARVRELTSDEPGKGRQ